MALVLGVGGQREVPGLSGRRGRLERDFSKL